MKKLFTILFILVEILMVYLYKTEVIQADALITTLIGYFAVWAILMMISTQKE